MLASYRWLKELAGVEASAGQYAERLTRAGLEVEEVIEFGLGLNGVVIGEVRGKRPHPERDKLQLVEVFDGESVHEVICGAPNVPEVGGRILFATFGAELPGDFVIGEREIGGVVSRGMICSESELGIGEGGEGIFICGADIDAAPGTAVVEALQLRDTVFDLGVTPNRPDCLGHRGLARELCLLFDHPFVPSEVPQGSFEAEAVSVPEHGEVRVTIAAPELCAGYAATVVTGITVRPSPFWLQYRLHCLGIRPISNAVDVTNLVLMERGHPIHGFDLNQISGRHIDVRQAREGEEAVTLDGATRAMVSTDLLITDQSGPVAVAGVMGGLESEVKEQTRDVLIECAHFEPKAVRRTSRRLGLKSEASHRFERGVDPGELREVASRAALLLSEICGGAVHPVGIDAVGRHIAPRVVTMRYARASALMGLEYAPERVRQILEGLGCALEESDDAVVATVPTWRPDLSREADLIEEVARIHGYDEVPATLPRVLVSGEGTPSHLLAYRRIREAGAAAGLFEAMNYAFVSQSALDASRAPEPRIKLANALSEDKGVMRTSLLPGLAGAAAHAQRRQVETVKLFEVGNTYHPCDDRLPNEVMRMGLLLVGPRRDWIGSDSVHDIYDMKGAIEAVMLQAFSVGVELDSSAALEQEAPCLHPARRARVLVAGHAVGVLGELHPEVVDSLPIDGRPIYAELDLGKLLDAIGERGVPQANEPPKFPMVRRDLALVVEEAVEVGRLQSELLEAAGGLAESVALFDLYRGEHVPDGHKSVALRIVYRDPTGTLTDKKVDKAHAKLGRMACETFGATLR